MLDDFKLEQNLIYKILTNSVINNKISHAYLIESNGYSRSLDFAISFAKYLFCPNKISEQKDCCLKCPICKTIDDKNFIDLTIIENDGQWIKKNQLEELQIDFSKTSINGNKKIYIIKDAYKLNTISSNSLLKFLEEPEKNIIAILITNNKNQILDTIVSRCQILSLKVAMPNDVRNTTFRIKKTLFVDNDDKNLPFDLDNLDKYILSVVNFIKKYEENHEKTIAYIKKFWFDIFDDKQKIEFGLRVMLFFYKDLLNCLLKNEIKYFFDYIDDLKSVLNTNSVNKVILKINVIINIIKLLNYNVNTNLIMDKLILDLEGCESI